MPVFHTAMEGLRRVAAGRSWATGPLAVHLVAIVLCVCALVFLALGGWPGMGGGVWKAGLTLLVPWFAGAVAGFGRAASPLAQAFAVAGAWLYAGFFLAVGVVSLRQFTPLTAPIAWGVILFGLLLLLVSVRTFRPD